MFKVCNKCVMDTHGNDEIYFDKKGICNYCYEYDEKFKIRVQHDKASLDNIVKKIKKAGEYKEYDCVIGVSGGVDSTYTAYLTHDLGLRPLAVHFDNGWNSELAIHNIQKILDKLNIDLFTYVVDWEEFKDLQTSFLKSSTPDGEIPTDHAILATLYDIANNHNIKYIISGNNFISEGVMPRKWAYGHIDFKYIKSVHRIYGSKKLKSYPRLNLLKFLWFTFFKGIKSISILNYVDYKKDVAMETITEKLDWKYYGGKHYESNYTKFFQGFILPKKFNIDKRKLHLSALILSNQISKQQALKILKEPIYPKDEVSRDTDYFKKKLDFNIQDFEKLLKDKPKTFFDYPNNYHFHSYLRKTLAFLRKKKLFYS